MKKILYSRKKRKIRPIEDEKINNKALVLKKKIKNDKDKFEKIPEKFQQNWKKVKLYSPSGDINKITGLLLDPKSGAYDMRNKLNHLTGKEWIKFTCSWFIFNALPEDLKEEQELDNKIADHPATFSPTMIADFIKFFTKEGETVLDPFLGIGTTLAACKRTHRIGYGIEINKKYCNLSKKRAPKMTNNVFNDDSRNINKLKLPNIDFCISSPPYWDMLNRSSKDFAKNRRENSLDVKYSNSNNDLGNISDYNEFVNTLCNIYKEIYSVLRKKAYVVIILKNVKKNKRMYPLAWDVAIKLSQLYLLKDEKIWIQDKAGLTPYGYPYSWTSNTFHHYCLILQKE